MGNYNLTSCDFVLEMPFRLHGSLLLWARFSLKVLLQNVNPFIPESEPIGIRSSSFTWTPENDGTATPGSSRRNFTLTIEEEVFFNQGSINLIVGQTGSGKTSLLMALLGMTLLDTSVLLIDKSGLKVKCIILQSDRIHW